MPGKHKTRERRRVITGEELGMGKEERGDQIGRWVINRKRFSDESETEGVVAGHFYGNCSSSAEPQPF